MFVYSLQKHFSCIDKIVVLNVEDHIIHSIIHLFNRFKTKENFIKRFSEDIYFAGLHMRVSNVTSIFRQK